MHNLKSKKGIVVLKIDLYKAYESVEWSFLDRTLAGFGFPKVIRRLIMFCVSFSALSIVWNGA